MSGLSSVFGANSDTIAHFCRGAGAACVFASAWTDLRARIIPHRLVFLVAASGAPVLLAAPADAIRMGLFAAFGLTVGLFILAALGAIGGGDAKLIPATSLLVPPDHVISLLFWIALCGGALGVVFLVLRRADGWLSRRGSGAPWAWIRAQVKDDLPFAVAIAGGLAITLVARS